jgi:hypothetical protein
MGNGGWGMGMENGERRVEYPNANPASGQLYQCRGLHLNLVSHP